MKKIILGIVVMLLLTSTTVLAASKVTNLYAGRGKTDVGDVILWDDGDNLYVKYKTTGDWYLTETHLHVATNLESIPQTRKGNPIPGHFDYKMVHDPPVQEYTYGPIPIDASYLHYAAHAVVVHFNNGCIDREDTAWGCGWGFPGNSWGLHYFYRTN